MRCRLAKCLPRDRVIAELRRRYPRLRLFLSTTTLAGQQLARRSVTDVDGVFYFPFDWTFSVRRTLDRVQPRLFVMIETEIWPNLLRECRRRRIATVLVNGRISYRSFPRYRLIRPFFRRVLADVDRFCVQGDEAARRLISLGADPARITITGSLKFDALEVIPTPGRGRERVLRFFRMSANRPVLVAGSTLKGEEEAVVRAFNRLRTGGSNALLVIAARHPERFGEVERLCRQEGLSTVRRTELPIDAEPRADAVILDTIGELAEVYQIATVVFVGGSLVPRRRPQHPRAGGLRQADRVRAAHGEFCRDRGRVPRQRRGGAGPIRSRARRPPSSASWAIRSGAPGSARPPAPWSTRTGARRTRRWR